MIVDCHTHIWADAGQLGPGGREYIRLQSGREDLCASPADHELSQRCVDRSLVLGHRPANGGGGVPNEYVAQYVGRSGGRAIGIAAVDPAEPSAVDEVANLLDQREFRGLTISPSCQEFHPADSRAMRIYDLAQERGAPVFIHQGLHFMPRGRMEFARPYLLDEIARDFPNLTLVISAMGYPWVDEGIALIGKHPRVFADMASLVRRPWQAYNALVQAHQFNVMDKVLFGSDFPFLTAAEAIESVYRLHEVTQGTNMPSVPREALRSVVERDALAALGIARAGEVHVAAGAGEEEEA